MQRPILFGASRGAIRWVQCVGVSDSHVLIKVIGQHGAGRTWQMQPTVGDHKSANALSMGSTAILRIYPMIIAGPLLRDSKASKSISLVGHHVSSTIAAGIGIRIYQHARRFMSQICNASGCFAAQESKQRSVVSNNGMHTGDLRAFPTAIPVVVFGYAQQSLSRGYHAPT